MHSALLIVEKPKLDNWDSPKNAPLARAWSTFLNNQNIAAEKHASIEALGEGCLLVTLEKGADVLADILHAVSQTTFPYRVLFFRKEPRWVRSNPSS